jgi:NAD(P)-dependent dehydrogenase (short-subunit alcohol dehydrogenase family)
MKVLITGATNGIGRFVAMLKAQLRATPAAAWQAYRRAQWPRNHY